MADLTIEYQDPPISDVSTEDVTTEEDFGYQDPAPYGYKLDGTPKAKPGRKSPGYSPDTGGSPSIDSLKSSFTGGVKDRAPEKPKREKGAPFKAPPYRAGVITVGMNGLYRKCGKIIRAFDQEVGNAFIESSRNTADPGEPDDSVGAAWDQLAKTNPRIRVMLLKLIQGGAWSALLYAHLPIAAAIVMKPMIRDHIPFGKLLASMAETNDEDGTTDLPGNMTQQDVSQASNFAMEQIKRMGFDLDPETAEKMQTMAASMVAPEINRRQPHRTTRTQRKRNGVD